MKEIFLAIVLFGLLSGCEPREDEEDLSELKRMVQVEKDASSDNQAR
jgi:hypothetical protein